MKIGMVSAVVAAMIVLSASGGASAATPNLPYSPGYLYKIFDNSAFWKDSAMPIPYKINSATIPSTLNKALVMGAVNNSFNTWKNDLGSYITFTFGGITTAKHSNFDNINSIYFDNIDSLGYCWVYIDAATGRIIDADICLDTLDINGNPIPWAIGAISGKLDVQDTLTHEVGHFIGLDDLTDATYPADADQTLWKWGEYNDISRRSLEKGDIAGLRYLYGGYRASASNVGSYQAGAGVDVGNVDGTTGLDMFAAWVDDPSGNNYIYYRLGKNVNTDTGNATWTATSKWTTAIGYYTSGCDVALGYIGGGTAVDALIAWVDNPTGQDTIKYVIGWDLTTSGVPASWSAIKSMPTDGVGYNNEGLGVKLASVTGTSRPDLVTAWVDNPDSGNDYVRYKIGKDIDTSGNIATWTAWSSFATNVVTCQDCGISVGDFDMNGYKDIVFSVMEWHTGPDSTNKITYKVGWNVDSNGAPTGWTGWTCGPAGWIGTESDGFGLACGQLNAYGCEELFFFWIDDTSDTGGNDAYYRMEYDGRLYGSHG